MGIDHAATLHKGWTDESYPFSGILKHVSMVATAYSARRHSLGATPTAGGCSEIKIGRVSGLLLLDLITTLQNETALASPHDLDVAARLDAIHGGTHFILDARDRSAFASWRVDSSRVGAVLASAGLDIGEASSHAALGAIERCVMACDDEKVVVMSIG